MSVDEAHLREWVGALLGGTVVSWARLVSGNSRTTWTADVERSGASEPVVVRVDPGDGPFSDTPLSLAREVEVYRALQGLDLPIPRLHGFDEAAGAVVLERAAGAPAWDGAVVDALLAALARLHALDVAQLDLPGFARSPRGDVELWAGILERRVNVASPIAEFAAARLLERYPGDPPRIVLDHGDPGIGNLLWEDGRITALLDWELSHIGDPIDDLAFLSVRAALFEVPLEGFGARVREHYAPAAGVALDEQRLRYWQAVGLLRNLITCLASISNPVRGRDRLVHHLLIPSLNRLIVDALARLEGAELPPPALTDAPPPPPGAEVVSEIAAGLSDLAATIADPEPRQRVRRMRYLLGQLGETWGLAPEVAAADAGAQPAAADPVERLHQLAAVADRRLSLFPRALALASARIAGFDD